MGLKMVLEWIILSWCNLSNFVKYQTRLYKFGYKNHSKDVYYKAYQHLYLHHCKLQWLEKVRI